MPYFRSIPPLYFRSGEERPDIDWVYRAENGLIDNRTGGLRFFNPVISPSWWITPAISRLIRFQELLELYRLMFLNIFSPHVPSAILRKP